MKNTLIIGLFISLLSIVSCGGNSGPEMVLVDGGEFLMGSAETEQVHFSSEQLHKVKVSSFYMAKFEASQKDLIEILGTAHASLEGFGERASDENSFYDAIAYCNKLSAKNGLEPVYSYGDLGTDMSKWPSDWNTSIHDKIICNWSANGYRLPTEAEFEYAARGGKMSKGYIYAGSNDPNEVAWYGLNTRIHPENPGLKKPNELGLYDMSGNVWDLCWDWYDADYYKVSPVDNPKGPSMRTDGMQARRVIRGGEWHMGQVLMRVNARNEAAPNEKRFSASIRVVRNI